MAHTHQQHRHVLHTQVEIIKEVPVIKKVFVPKPYPKPVPVHPKHLIPATIISHLAKHALKHMKVEIEEEPEAVVNTTTVAAPVANTTAPVVAARPAVQEPTPVPTFTMPMTYNTTAFNATANTTTYTMP
jgi:hypothetical protein